MLCTKEQYEVTVDHREWRGVNWKGQFTEMPTVSEVAEAIEYQRRFLKMCDDSNEDHDEMHSDEIYNLGAICEIVSYARSLVKPDAEGQTVSAVNVAGIQIGKITIVSKAVFSRDARKELEAMVA